MQLTQQVFLLGLLVSVSLGTKGIKPQSDISLRDKKSGPTPSGQGSLNNSKNNPGRAQIVIDVQDL
jgi:hypothetical protein